MNDKGYQPFGARAKLNTSTISALSKSREEIRSGNQPKKFKFNTNYRRENPRNRNDQSADEYEEVEKQIKLRSSARSSKIKDSISSSETDSQLARIAKEKPMAVGDIMSDSGSVSSIVSKMSYKPFKLQQKEDQARRSKPTKRKPREQTTDLDITQIKTAKERREEAKTKLKETSKGKLPRGRPKRQAEETKQQPQLEKQTGGRSKKQAQKQQPKEERKQQSKSKPKTQPKSKAKRDPSSSSEDESRHSEESKRDSVPVQGKKRPFKDIKEEELDMLFDLQELADLADGLIDQQHNSTIFRSNALKKFLTNTLAEINPTLSVAGITLDYFSMFFTHFMMPRVSFCYWDIMNDQERFKFCPDAVKKDHFIEQCWKESFEDDHRIKFIYGFNF